MNLKHWKMKKKKSTGRCIGLAAEPSGSNSMQLIVVGREWDFGSSGITSRKAQWHLA
jgi:hypothetical protein